MATVDLAGVLEAGSRRLKTLAKQTAHAPTADHVHDLRVVTRRLRADFWVIPPQRRSTAVRRARRDLERLGEILGEQRKYDVALADAHRFHAPTTRIRRRLDAARRHVVAALRRGRRRTHLRHLRRAVRDARRLDPAVIRLGIARLRRRLAHALQRPPARNQTRHRLRINVKRARYLLEAAGRPVAPLVTLQDALGRWHDLMVLAEISGRTAGLAEARADAWRKAERQLRPGLRSAIRGLTALIEITPVVRHRRSRTGPR
jgi:CHAD domain-containing protein